MLELLLVSHLYFKQVGGVEWLLNKKDDKLDQYKVTYHATPIAHLLVSIDIIAIVATAISRTRAHFINFFNIILIRFNRLLINYLALKIKGQY